MSEKKPPLYLYPGKCRGRTKFEHDAAKEAARTLNKEAFLCNRCSAWHISTPPLNPASPSEERRVC